jgi:hypothetical protein
MRFFYVLLLTFLSASVMADMKTITEVYEADSARMENIGASQAIVVVKKCDKCEPKKINLAENVNITYQGKELSPQEYVMNYPRFKYFFVSHHLLTNQVTRIQAF